jgi:hypothetical protein
MACFRRDKRALPRVPADPGLEPGESRNPR